MNHHCRGQAGHCPIKMVKGRIIEEIISQPALPVPGFHQVVAVGLDRCDIVYAYVGEHVASMKVWDQRKPHIERPYMAESGKAVDAGINYLHGDVVSGEAVPQHVHPCLALVDESLVCSAAPHNQNIEAGNVFISSPQTVFVAHI